MSTPKRRGRPRTSPSTHHTATIEISCTPELRRLVERAAGHPRHGAITAYVTRALEAALGRADAEREAWRMGRAAGLREARAALERLPEPESVVRVPRVGDLVRTVDDPTPRRVRWVGPSDHGPVVDLEAAGSHALNLIADLLSDQPKRSDE